MTRQRRACWSHAVALQLGTHEVTRSERKELLASGVVIIVTTRERSAKVGSGERAQRGQLTVLGPDGLSLLLVNCGSRGRSERVRGVALADAPERARCC